MAAALHRISRGGRRFFFSENAPVVRRALHTSVWWDMASCKVPKRCDASSIAGNITRALANLNYDAPVTISAYGNTYLIPLKVQHALSDSGVSLIHAVYNPSRAKYPHYTEMTSDILSWTDAHPAPANCLIISDDESFVFSFVMNSLSPDPYNILIAKPGKVDCKMELTPKAMWRWTSLRAGGLPEWTSQ